MFLKPEAIEEAKSIALREKPREKHAETVLRNAHKQLESPDALDANTYLNILESLSLLGGVLPGRLMRSSFLHALNAACEGAWKSLTKREATASAQRIQEIRRLPPMLRRFVAASVSRRHSKRIAESTGSGAAKDDLAAEDAEEEAAEERGASARGEKSTEGIDQDFELIAWVCACRIDLTLRMIGQANTLPFGGNTSLEEVLSPNTKRPPWLISPDVEAAAGLKSNETLVCPDARTVWRCLSVVAAKLRSLDRYEPSLGAYISRLYDRCCVLTFYGESRKDRQHSHLYMEAPDGPFVAKHRPASTGTGDDAHEALHNHPMFYKTIRGHRLPNAAFLRDCEMMFRCLLGSLEPRCSMPEEPLRVSLPNGPEALIGLPMFNIVLLPLMGNGPGSALRFAEWCVNVADGVLKENIRYEFQRRLYQQSVEPGERERFMREDRFGDPTANNVIARYRPGVFDAIMDWMQAQSNPVLSVLNALASRCRAVARGGPVPPIVFMAEPAAGTIGATGPISLPHPKLAEQLALEVVLKYGIDTTCGLNTLLPQMYERHRRAEFAARRPPKGERPDLCLVQMLNLYELASVRKDGSVAIHPLPDDFLAINACGSPLVGAFMIWLAWRCAVHGVFVEAAHPALCDLFMEVFQKDPPAQVGVKGASHVESVPRGRQSIDKKSETIQF